MFKPKNEAILQCGCSWPLLLYVSGGGYSRPETMKPSSAKWNEQIRGLKVTLQPTGYWRIKGICPNHKCGQAFEFHSKEERADKIAMLVFFYPVQPEDFRIAFGKVEQAQRIKRNMVWADWIPSPRGPQHYQRLFLDSHRKEFFALAASSSIQIGLPRDLYPDWNPEAASEQFGEWANELQDKREEYEFSLIIRAKKTNRLLAENFMQEYREALKPIIACHCQAATNAMMQRFGKAKPPASIGRKKVLGERSG